MFVFVYDSMHVPSHEMIDNIIIPVLEEMHMMLKIYAFDCQDAVTADNPKYFYMCEQQRTPFLQLYRPMDTRINPETNQLN